MQIILYYRNVIFISMLLGYKPENTQKKEFCLIYDLRGKSSGRFSCNRNTCFKMYWLLKWDFLCSSWWRFHGYNQLQYFTINHLHAHCIRYQLDWFATLSKANHHHGIECASNAGNNFSFYGYLCPEWNGGTIKEYVEGLVLAQMRTSMWYWAFPKLQQKRK